MHEVQEDIREIKVAMLKHNEDDNKHFGDISRQLSTSHDIHVRNEEILKNILTQAQKTTGRVTSLEEMCARLDKSNALIEQSNHSLYTIVSRQNSEYEGWAKRQEDKLVTKADFDPVKKLAYGIVSIILTAVIVALLSLVVGGISVNTK